jgi:hypothetical protein
LRAVTFAFGTAEPDGSVTVPVIEPPACCAHIDTGTLNNIASRHATPDLNSSFFEFTGILLKCGRRRFAIRWGVKPRYIARCMLLYSNVGQDVKRARAGALWISRPFRLLQASLIVDRWSLQSFICAING